MLYRAYLVYSLFRCLSFALLIFTSNIAVTKISALLSTNIPSLLCFPNEKWLRLHEYAYWTLGKGNVRLAQKPKIIWTLFWLMKLSLLKTTTFLSYYLLVSDEFTSQYEASWLDACLKQISHWLRMTRAVKRWTKAHGKLTNHPLSVWHSVSDISAGSCCQNVNNWCVPCARHPPLTVSARADTGAVCGQHRVQRGTESRAR